MLTCAHNLAHIGQWHGWQGLKMGLRCIEVLNKFWDSWVCDLSHSGNDVAHSPPICAIKQGGRGWTLAYMVEGHWPGWEQMSWFNVAMCSTGCSWCCCWGRFGEWWVGCHRFMHLQPCLCCMISLAGWGYSQAGHCRWRENTKLVRQL